MALRKFTVSCPELHTSYVDVQAESVEDAINRARAGEGEETECVYTRTFDPDEWNWDALEVKVDEGLETQPTQNTTQTG